MAIKPRSPGQTGTSISLPTDLLQEIDKRARALRLTRSQYLIRLAEEDLARGGDLAIRETPAPYRLPSSSQKIEYPHFPKKKKSWKIPKKAKGDSAPPE